jgi:hypothetical protein
MRLKIFLTGLILSILVTLIAAPLSVPQAREFDDGVTKSFSSSCLIDRHGNDGLGSGVLLDTGYILTAAHVVDGDMDGILEKGQRTRTVEMFGEEYEVTVAYISSKGDFAFLKPTKPIPHRGATVSKQQHRLGDKAYTIGATEGHPLNISPGFVLTPGASGHPRVSCYISVGNSGGGIFDSKDEVMGIVSMVGITQSMTSVSFRMPLFDNGHYRVVTVTGSSIVREKVKNNCLFVSSDRIRSELKKRSISSLLDLPKSATTLDVVTSSAGQSIIKCIISVSIFAWMVFYVRRYIFSK